MLLDYFKLGRHEIVNSARLVGYSEFKVDAATWLSTAEVCETLEAALEHSPYTHDHIQHAPWFDADDVDLWSRFLGVMAVDVRGLSDSTSESESTELLGAGSRTTNFRDGSRSIRFRVFLAAAGEDALEAGLTWLRTVLRPGVEAESPIEREHAVLSFFATCPPDAAYHWESDEEYRERVRSLRREYHDVVLDEPPIVLDRMESSDKLHVGALVEFSLRAQNPYLYGAPRELALNPSTPYLTQDIPYNLIRFPRAAKAEGSVEIGRNYIQNPSVEVNATGWEGQTGTLPSSGVASHGRNGERYVAGAWSFRSRLAGAGSPAAAKASANIYILSPVVYFPDPGGVSYVAPPAGSSILPANARISATIWAAAVIASGTSNSTNLDQLDASLVWTIRDVSGVSSQATAMVADGPIGDRRFSISQVTPPAVPAGSYIASVRIEVRAQVRYTSSATAADNSDIRVYADAAAITIP